MLHSLKRLGLILSLCITPLLAQTPDDFYREFAMAAKAIEDPSIYYDPGYFSIDYPMGDIPSTKGVCTDVVIRAYRKLGIDLQELVHEDMRQNFTLYPSIWGLKKADSNIDHRRVPNLMCFFGRKGETLVKSTKAEDYQAGDIVCWSLGGGIMHIGLVLQERSSDGLRPLLMHNIGNGQVAEDLLFDFTIIGHYRYKP